jgi:hypothetical protein
VEENSNHRDSLCLRLWQAAVTPGWPRRVPAILLVLGLAVHLSPESAVRPGLAAVVLATCLANLGRIGTHLYGGYLLLRPSKIRASQKPSVRRHLSALVIANLTLTLTGMAGAIALMVQPEVPLLLRIGPAFLLCLAFYLVALATVERADELDLKRGTEIVRESRFGSWLFKIARKGTRFPPARWLVELFDNPTPLDEPSTLALVIAAVLLFAPLAAMSSELGAAAEKQAIAAFTTEDDSDEESTSADEEPQEKPSEESGSQLGPTENETIQASPVHSGLSDLHVIIGKTSTDNPQTQIPLSPADIPLVVAVLPLIARWYQLTPASAKDESSIYVLARKDTTLFFKVVGR